MIYTARTYPTRISFCSCLMTRMGRWLPFFVALTMFIFVYGKEVVTEDEQVLKECHLRDGEYTISLKWHGLKLKWTQYPGNDDIRLGWTGALIFQAINNEDNTIYLKTNHGHKGRSYVTELITVCRQGRHQHHKSHTALTHRPVTSFRVYCNKRGHYHLRAGNRWIEAWLPLHTAIHFEETTRPDTEWHFNRLRAQVPGPRSRAPL